MADSIGDVRERVDRSPFGFAIVISDGGVLLGRLRASEMLGADDAASAEALMEPGPFNVRPDIAAAELAKLLAQRDLKSAVISTPEGRLIGVVRRHDLEAVGA